MSPDTVIGQDLETGEDVLAGCHGIVSTARFSGGNHAFTVIIQCRA